MNALRRLAKGGINGTQRIINANRSRSLLPLQSIPVGRASTKPIDKVDENADLALTEACVEQLKKVSQNGEFLRVMVEGGGCSGFSYKFELDSEKEEDDRTFSRDGMEVVVDTDSFELIKGSTIDYEVEIIKAAFRVKDNPQSNNNCSCGVSFSIDLKV